MLVTEDVSRVFHEESFGKQGYLDPVSIKQTGIVIDTFDTDIAVYVALS